eukprot:scaffold141202_cov37-Prasinocladus_malaysianus.AAC.2
MSAQEEHHFLQSGRLEYSLALWAGEGKLVGTRAVTGRDRSKIPFDTSSSNNAETVSQGADAAV